VDRFKSLHNSGRFANNNGGGINPTASSNNASQLYQIYAQNQQIYPVKGFNPLRGAWGDNSGGGPVISTSSAARGSMITKTQKMSASPFVSATGGNNHGHGS
jgi:hypothetical protein